MKYLVLIFLCVVNVLASPLNDKVAKLNAPGSRIILGTPARLGQFPWQAAVIAHLPNGRNSFCGGSLISPHYILTAAHCAVSSKNYTIYLGTLSITPDTTAIRTVSYEPIVHPNYIGNLGAGNDVALLRLPNAVVYNQNVQPIALATDVFPDNQNLTVSGWGKTSDKANTVSQILNYVNLTSISHAQCSIYYTGVTPNVLCAVGVNTSSTCNGDSGGGLVSGAQSGRPVHVAVVSFVSSRGCESRYPSGYTRTSAVRSWIRQVTGI